MLALLWLGGLALAQDLDLDDGDLSLAGQIHMSYAHSIADDPAALGDLNGVSGLEIHVWQGGFDGDRTSALFGLELGGGRGGGFAWNTELLMGPGGWVNGRFGGSLQVGPSIGGVTRHVPVAFSVPIEASLIMQPLNRLRLRPWARSSFVVGSDHVRKDGATSVPFLDEFRWGVDAYLGEMLPVDVDGDLGWHLGFSWEEVMGTRLLGFQIGTALGEAPEHGDMFGGVSEQDLQAMLELFEGELDAEVGGQLGDPEGGEGEGVVGGLMGEELTPASDPSVTSVPSDSRCTGWTSVVKGFEGDFAARVLGPHPDGGGRQRTDLSLPRAVGTPVVTTAEAGVGWEQSLWTGDSATEGQAAWLAAADDLTDCALPGTWIAERNEDGESRSAWWIPFDAAGTPWHGKRLDIVLEPIPESTSWRVMARARPQ